VVNLGTQLPKDKGIPEEGTAVGSDKAVVREGNCLGGTGVGNPEELDTVEGSKAVARDRARQVDSLVGGTVQSSLLVVVGLRRNQILRCLIVIKDITIGILEESDIASQLQRWVDWVAEVKKLRVLKEDMGCCGEPHFLSVHELVRHLRQGLVEGAEFHKAMELVKGQKKRELKVWLILQDKSFRAEFGNQVLLLLQSWTFVLDHLSINQ
jgi:hypothetical protein